MITSQQNIKSYINFTNGVIRPSVAEGFMILLHCQYGNAVDLNPCTDQWKATWRVNYNCDNLIYETRLINVDWNKYN